MYLPPFALPGRLRIGDHWNVITILAISQNYFARTVVEFAENSIAV